MCYSNRVLMDVLMLLYSDLWEQQENGPIRHYCFILMMVDDMESLSLGEYHEQEFMVLSTRYRMTNDPSEPPKRTTKIFIKPTASYPFLDYFNSTERAQKWPNNIVYYEFVDDFSMKVKSLLGKCFRILENRTCIRFQRFRNLMSVGPNAIQPLKIHFIPKRHCITSIGYNPWGNNRMHLNPKFCGTESAILHLLMHILGFDHEHVRMDSNYFLKIIYYADYWMRDEYDISKHHNTYDYMPYNWDSIMHMAAIYPIQEIVIDTHKNSQTDGDSEDSGFLKHTKPSIDKFWDWPARYKFKDWFPNDLHQLDLNNINRHYQCGEYHNLCKDYADMDDCLYLGLGQRMTKISSRKQVVNIQKYAQCVNTTFAERRCPKTCGHCYIFYKNDMSLISKFRD